MKDKNHKRTHRSKVNQDMLEKFTLYYQNIRGVKSKWNSLKNLIMEKQPVMVALVETHLNEHDTLEEVPGYKVIRRERKIAEGGGIAIFYKTKLEGLITLLPTCEQHTDKVVWIKVANTRISIKIGIVYMPQESLTPKQELQSIYNTFGAEIEKSLIGEERIMMVGDFNCRIGEKIKGNETTVSKRGKMMQKMMTKYDLQLINGTEKCEGLWTRQEGASRSVLDYAIIKKEDLRYLSKMKIDEERNECPYAVRSQQGGKILYSDHNVIEVAMDWLKLVKDQNQSARSGVTRKGYERFERQCREVQISNMIGEADTIQDDYTRWSTKVKEMLKENETKIKQMTSTNKIIKTLTKIEKGIRQTLRKVKN